jgi:hypothetical protein
MLKLILVFAVPIIVGLAVLAALEARKRQSPKISLDDGAPPSEDTPAFQARGHLMSKAEREFHDVLLGIVGPRGYRLFPQIPLPCLVSLPSVPNRQAWINKTDRKRVDFVLCEPKQLRVILAIELDDASHGRDDRKERDGLVENILKKAGVPLLRQKCDPRGYVRDDLARAVNAALGNPSGSPATPLAPPSSPRRGASA